MEPQTGTLRTRLVSVPERWRPSGNGNGDRNRSQSTVVSRQLGTRCRRGRDRCRRGRRRRCGDHTWRHAPEECRGRYGDFDDEVCSAHDHQHFAFFDHDVHHSGSSAHHDGGPQCSRGGPERTRSRQERRLWPRADRARRGLLRCLWTGRPFGGLFRRDPPDYRHIAVVLQRGGRSRHIPLMPDLQQRRVGGLDREDQSCAPSG